MEVGQQYRLDSARVKEHAIEGCRTARAGIHDEESIARQYGGARAAMSRIRHRRASAT